ncbi:MAG: polysaccharide deacetylase [Micavibrio sp.]|nr:MAG: polysaccharide deacetylase [Micavibrio sp.]
MGSSEKKLITFTLDLEDHRLDENLPERYPVITDKILGFLDEHKIKATVFTVGALAEKNPQLIRRIHEAGHEIAHHSYDHTPLTKQGRNQFQEHTKRAKDILEDIAGEKITGYRAPVFSLTKDTLWAVDILKELGFEYSSSVLPVANPLHGLPGAPSTPFKWSNGLIEIPAPIGKVGPFLMPYLGGFYFRYLPFGVIKNQVKKADDSTIPWTYCHPYDFDAEEKNWRIKGASVPVSLLLWINRKNTFSKLERLTDSFEFSKPFKDQNFKKVKQIVDPATL